MLLSQVLDIVHKFTPQELSALSDLLSPELIDECLADTGVVTLRKRRLSMEMIVGNPPRKPGVFISRIFS